jgi:hypothetical protein
MGAIILAHPADDNGAALAQELLNLVNGHHGPAFPL